MKVYADRLSQPSRAVLIFCKINGIDFEEILIDLSKNQQHSTEYKAINPLCQVPAIVDGRFKLSERINGIDFEEILIDLSKNQQHSPEYKAINPLCQVPAIVDGRFKLSESMQFLFTYHVHFREWLVTGDLSKRAKIHSVLDWHHSNLRRGAAVVSLNALSPLNGSSLSPEVTKEAEKILVRSLSTLESFWLKDGRFLVGSSQPSVADLSLVCEIMQLELLSEKDYERILSPYKKVLRWVEDTKRATAPHFDEVHGILFRVRKKLRERMATQSVKNELKAKL